jgi:hypothetical protein
MRRETCAILSERDIGYCKTRIWNKGGISLSAVLQYADITGCHVGVGGI